MIGTLAELMAVGPTEVQQRCDSASGVDFVAMAGHAFVIEFSQSSSAGPVAAAAKKVRERARAVGPSVMPLLVVPFMGEVGRKVCQEAAVGWFDLSGNARIVVPGIRVIVDGRPNRFLSAGRPANLFAPKSSRLVRWLLAHYPTGFNQRQLANATGLDEGFVSRLASRLVKDEYLNRDEFGALRPRDPQLMLDAWRESNQFSKHLVYQGHVASRSGDALLRFVASIFGEQGMNYAATGLAGAWALTRFAGFRIATLYVPAEPTPALLEQLGYRADPRGANLWLVVPNDIGVFQGALEKDGIRCVHPVQVYVDLKGHPERAAEASVRLRTDFLAWGRND